MIVFRELGLQDYDNTYQKMKAFTAARKEIKCTDEIWLLEHPRVITIGSSGNLSDVVLQSEIPIVHTDRGGQVTYHGPGQLIGYFLLDLRSRSMKIAALIENVEKSLCNTLYEFGLKGETSSAHPGIYVDGKKIASFGLKVVNGCTYHGFSLNVCMDLQPFSSITPCGLKNVTMVNMIDYSNHITINDVIATSKKMLSAQFI